MKNMGQKLIVTIAVLVSLACLVSMIAIFNNTVNDELSRSATERLSDEVDRQQTAVNYVLESKLKALLTLSASVDLINTDQAMYEYLEQSMALLSSDRIYVVDNNGVGFDNEGKAVDLSSREFFKEIAQPVPEVSNPYITTYSGNCVMTAAAPFADGTGYVAVDFDIEYLQELLFNQISRYGNILIVNSDGGPVLGMVDSPISSNEFMSMEFSGGHTPESIIADYKAGNSGSVSFYLGTERIIAEYRPIEARDWLLFYYVYEDEMLATERSISDGIIAFSGFIIAFFALMTIYMVYTKSNSIKEIKKTAYYDELTGLRNLVKFKLDAEQVLINNPDKKYGMVKVDIENFKAINEMFDFDIGNEVLVAFSKTGASVPDPSFFMGRASGDEFLMFASADLMLQLEELSTHYEAFFKEAVPSLGKHHLTFRYGRYIIEDGETNVNEIINKVGMAHSNAKKNHDVLISDYDDKMKKYALTIADLTNKMEDALANGDLQPFLQPKFGVSDGDVVGAEALVRWIEPSGNMIYPNDFIPLFEANGFIVKLDMKMLEDICKTIKTWEEEGHELIPISVNFSRVHLKFPSFVDDMKAIVDRCGIDAKYIEVELTETTMTENQRALETLLDQLKGAGFAVSIDDFGAGYSSLGLLKNFRVDTLKLDRSFFVDTKYGERGDLVVDGIIKLAHSLDMKIVAEGIEESEQVNFLKTVDCEAAQGYFYAKPMPISEFKAKYIEK